MGFPAAKRSNIEAAGLKRGLQREIVDLRIMGDRRNRGIGIERARLQHRLRPIGMQRHIRKTLRRGKGRTRIDDFHVEAGDFRHRRQRLADMNRADHHKARRAAARHSGTRTAPSIG